MKKILVLIILIIVNINRVFAYVDPGTAGMIIGGGIWPFILAILVAISGFFVKFFFKPIKKGVLKAWGEVKRKS